MDLPLLRDLALALDDTYTGDCTHYAEQLARGLLDAGHAPWIGVLREVEVLPAGRTYHGPLTPLKYAGRQGPTWNVHYVCCCGNDAFDPILGEPVAVDDLGELLFGRKLPVQKVVPEDDTARLLRSDGLREHLKTLRRR